MIPCVGMHQTTFVMMGDRIAKCVDILPNEKKKRGRDSLNEIRHKCELNSQREITNIDECKWDFYEYA